MHKFLRTIGFSNYRRENEVKALLEVLSRESDNARFFQTDRDSTLCEIRNEVAPGLGIAMFGQMNDRDELDIRYYYPYIESGLVSSKEQCTIQRHAEKETFAGMLDEYAVGVSLIFYLLNPIEYRDKFMKYGPRLDVSGVRLSALASEGTILLPIQFTEKQKEKDIILTSKRNEMLKAARDGDAEAMEALTFSEYDLFNQIIKRVENEDIYSIVDSTFLPSGLESDQYQVLGMIEDLKEKKNRITEEIVYDMLIRCNGIRFRVAVNREDLLGEPAVGRRFKGKIWMQGIANFTVA
ncbi:MAG: DUF3881 family protein [Bacillota bacterium]|uniref:Uncharacterized protein n=1 Tax=[Clostridium] aminophilum TaxID=1526 RepID=A0A1I6J0M3_9FIRM|nr:DUF3881 family protein [[Clostridium] aminophilum]MCR4629490.1 DUF3881 family protein [Clostridium sp.]MDT3844030.1 DUF3881 family protein [Bacillota bacterium]SFR72431.1 protein of unknown function [[Clostridium] aminophilum]